MFKDRLIQLRKGKKLTQEQMAEKVGVHRAHMLIMKEAIDSQTMKH